MRNKSHKSSSSNASHAVIESLDSRQLMSVSLNPTSHVLNVVGTSRNDTVILNIDGDKVKVTDNGAVSYFSRFLVSSISIKGLGGNDSLRATDAVYQPMTISGGDGNDFLRGGSGNDKLLGDAGNDTMDGANGADVFKGGAGIDTADYSSRTVSVAVTIDNYADDGRFGESDNVMTDVENVSTGSGDDYIVGSSAANTLNGGAGNDEISGRDGNDIIIGGAGNDFLAGWDTVLTSDSDVDNDLIYGNDGNDVLIAADQGNGSLHGGNGNDRLYGSFLGQNHLYGDAGDDLVVSLNVNYPGDYLYGGAGNDTLKARNSNYFDHLDGGTGDDTAEVERFFDGTTMYADTYINVEHVTVLIRGL